MKRAIFVAAFLTSSVLNASEHMIVIDNLPVGSEATLVSSKTYYRASNADKRGCGKTERDWGFGDTFEFQSSSNRRANVNVANSTAKKINDTTYVFTSDPKQEGGNCGFTASLVEAVFSVKGNGISQEVPVRLRADQTSRYAGDYHLGLCRPVLNHIRTSDKFKVPLNVTPVVTEQANGTFYEFDELEKTLSCSVDKDDDNLRNGAIEISIGASAKTETHVTFALTSPYEKWRGYNFEKMYSLSPITLESLETCEAVKNVLQDEISYFYNGGFSHDMRESKQMSCVSSGQSYKLEGYVRVSSYDPRLLPKVGESVPAQGTTYQLVNRLRFHYDPADNKPLRNQVEENKWISIVKSLSSSEITFETEKEFSNDGYGNRHLFITVKYLK